jgi:serine/threonine protein kinase
MTPEDLAATKKFSERLPARYHVPIDDLDNGECLTQGGTGVVMTARLRSTREQCVVKLNKDRNPTAVRHFLREIFISLCMQHRFIARPLGVAFATGGVHGVEALLVLERGVCSLEDFVVAKRQQAAAGAPAVSDADIEQYFGFARQIALAMAFLHARGVLHLDQKPANVMLFNPAALSTATPANAGAHTTKLPRAHHQAGGAAAAAAAAESTAASSGLASVDLSTLSVAKIVDLGFAVLSSKGLEEEGFADGTGALTHITATSVGLTKTYASHEQLNAQRGTKLRPTMDVYSFGAILYRLLCVSAPHEGQKADDILQRKLITDAMNEENLLPAFRAANAAHTVAAKQLVDAMRMCLQHDPKQRPQTGTDVLKLLLREGEELPAHLGGFRSLNRADQLDALIELIRQRPLEAAAAAAANSSSLSKSQLFGN